MISKFVKNRWFINLTLVALVASLSLLLMYKPGLKEKTAATPLSDINSDNITSIKIVRQGKDEIILQRQNTSWLLTQPINARSNEFNVKRILNLLSINSDTQFTAEGKQLKKYGLEQATTKIFLNDLEIAIGIRHPLKSSQYLLYNNKIHLVPSALMPPTIAYTDYISGKLIEKDKKIVEIVLPQATFKLDKGIWLLQPANDEISNDDINNLIDEWRYANALSVYPYQGKPIDKKIVIRYLENDTDTSNKELVIGIIAYKPDFILYRQDEGLEYRFPEHTRQRLLFSDKK